jgi:hypothetical protein
MPPRSTSRHSFCLGVLDPGGRRLLTEREPLRFREFPDNRQHRVVEGDTLWGLAGLYFAPLPRACGFWWAIADFQPDPILDPTLTLEIGRPMVIPSGRLLCDIILRDTRRIHE